MIKRYMAMRIRRLSGTCILFFRTIVVSMMSLNCYDMPIRPTIFKHNGLLTWRYTLDCTDTPSWNDFHGNGCHYYAKNWCENGLQRLGWESVSGAEHDYPEVNCCACRDLKGKTTCDRALSSWYMSLFYVSFHDSFKILWLQISQITIPSYLRPSTVGTKTGDFLSVVCKTLQI